MGNRIRPIDRKDFRLAGRVLKAHGLKGDLVTLLDTDTLDGCPFVMLDMEGLLVPFGVEEFRARGDGQGVMRLRGVSDDRRIEQVVGRDVYLPKGEGVDDGMFSYEDLIGFTVLYRGNALGEIADIDDQTVNVLFVVNGTEGEILIPAAEEYVVSVDAERRALEMDFPEGLLAING